MTPSEKSPVMLLREVAGRRRWLAIAIGTPEADALLAAKEGIESPRPSTVELIGQVLAAFGHSMARVEVTELRDGVFLSDLVLEAGQRVSARPSDAVALGVRAGVPVEVAEDVLAAASVEVTVTDSSGEAQPAAAEEAAESDVVADFRAFLDTVDPEDFDGGSP